MYVKKALKESKINRIRTLKSYLMQVTPYEVEILKNKSLTLQE